MKAYPLYARKDKNDNYQALSEHLDNVADLSAYFAGEFSNTAKLSGILHDIGKASRTFQEYLKEENSIRGSVVHSLQGAFCVSEITTNQPSDVFAQELIEMVIAAHHGHLPDSIDVSGDNVFFEKMSAKSEEKYNYSEVIRYFENLYNTKLFSDCSAEIQKLLYFIKNSYRNSESANFAIGLFVKYIYSCLIDADRLDAYLFDVKGLYEPIYTDWKNLINTFETEISEFKNDTDLSKIRAEISCKCKDASDRETGIYRLSLPTGSGKTLSSLRFALHHTSKMNKKRIIYVIPYLSITTQTAATIRDILKLNDDSHILLEHYSSVTQPETEKENDKRRLATARWDNPIIITTMVQFLETVMSAKGGDLRKFHNMQDSVIIFDEIQSLPINCVHLFNETVSFLSKILNSTIVLCTATQPIIDKTNKKSLLLSDKPDLIDDYKKYGTMLKRTNIVACNTEKTLDEFSQIVFEKATENGNCLCIVNLKSESREIYKTLKTLNAGNDFEIIHLSTAMCGENRRDALAEVKHFLSENKKVICVSTQLIEAGIDISFACVVRAMAGLDSILQAAGRCNRNGEYPELKKVYIFPISGEKGLEKLSDIKIGKEITQRVIRENPDADYLNENILNKFYYYYFYKRFDEMDYIVKNGTTVYDMLSNNDTGRGNFKNRTGRNYNHYLSQAFATASENFSVIPNPTITVVVYFGESENLLDKFKIADISEKIILLQKMQDYTVSLFDYEFKSLQDKKAISLFDEGFGIYVLDKDYYSKEYGVKMAAEMQNLVI